VNALGEFIHGETHYNRDEEMLETEKAKSEMVDSRSKCNSAPSRFVRRWQKEAMEKMENKGVFHFPTHCCGYLFESVHEICCTWNLNVPTPSCESWRD